MASKQQGTAQLEILSGWKDIANHLRKGVRTVQRYERELGLPVRRLSGKAKGGIVATKSDLDSWVISSATAQESLNKEQKSLNAEQKSFNRAQGAINSAQKSLNPAQESFNKNTRSAADRLLSEIARGLSERAGIQAQMIELRKELRMGVRNIREDLSKLRQQLNEMHRRQDFMASMIKDHSKVRAFLSVNGKRRKPN